MKFNIRDIDVGMLKERALKEAKEILKSDAKTKGRTPLEVKINCLYGQAAECYLIQYQGYTDDSDDFKDVKDKNGIPVEVKVTSKESNVKYVLERCNAAIKRKFREHPTKLIVFIGDKTTLDYHLYGHYLYNGIEFIKEQND